MRTGVSASRMPRKPSLLWVTEIGPTISSPIFANDTIFVSTIWSYDDIASVIRKLRTL
jgi:hypothetical protein